MATKTLKLDGVDIIELLIKSGMDINQQNAEVSFDVPGGGDWSNVTLGVDSVTPVVVTYEETPDYGSEEHF